MVKPKKWQLRILFFFILSFFKCSGVYSSSKLNFFSKCSTFILKDSSANVSIGGTVETRGWDEHSIIKNWNDSHVATLVTVDYSSANYDLVFSNSDAVVVLDSNLTATMNAVYSDIETYSASMETWVGSIETDVATNVSDISTVNTLITNTMNAVYSDLETYSASMETWVGGIETDVATNASDISTVNTLITNTMNAVYSDIETYSASMETWVGSIETDVATNVSDISTVNTLITNTMNAVYDDIKTMSDYHWDLIEANSDAVVAGGVGLTQEQEDLLYANSTAINDIDSQLSAIDDCSKHVSFSGDDSFTYNYFLHSQHKMNITGDTTLDGHGCFVHFSRRDDDTNLLSIDNGVTLTLEQVVLKDFEPRRFNTNSTGSIIFGDGTIIEITENTEIDTEYTMSFDGRVRINCYGCEFDVSAMPYALDVLPGATLEMCNAYIKGLGDITGDGSCINNIKCIGSDSTITFSNCELALAGNYSFTEGHMNFYRDVLITGTNRFAYTSPQCAVVKSKSKLHIDNNVTFSYDSNSQDKTKLTLEDETSALHLSGCVLYVTATGLQIDTGRLIIENKVTVNSEASIPAEAIIFKDSLEIDVLSGGVIDLVNGIIDYES
jgi:hypothetical protein